MDKKYLNIDKQTLIIIAIIIIAALATVFYGYAYYFVKNSLRESAFSMVDSAVKEEKTKESISLSQLYKLTVDERVKLENLYITEDTAVKLIESIESISVSNGSKITIASVDRITTPTPFISKLSLGDMSNLATSTFPGAISVKVSFQGSWSVVLASLDGLDKLPYVSFVDNVRIDAMPIEQVSKIRTWRLSADVLAPIYSGIIKK